MINPITDELLDSIFKMDPNIHDRLLTRESTTVEFKRNFNRGPAWNTYGRTIAAFANARGGCIVFGVTNSPRQLEGMANDNFGVLDPAELTAFLNEKFSPELIWHSHIHEMVGKQFGILYICENQEKPVIARSNGGDKIFEGDIYYRYRGRSEKIKYPELRRILEEQRKQEQALWLRHLQNIASIGVSNAAVFNPLDGKITGKAGTFIIDKKLLPKLQFIREGEFREVTGAPTIRIVGEAQVLAAGEVHTVQTVTEKQAIHAREIVEAFLLQQELIQPRVFIEQMCYETTGYLPIYYFAQKATLTKDELIGLIMAEQSTARGKKGLLDRLQGKDDKLSYKIPETESVASTRKKVLREELLKRNLSEPKDIPAVAQSLDAIRSLKAAEIDLDYVFPMLLNWYLQYWEQGNNLRTLLYKAICHLDKILYGY
jgi:hypothetical protein